jgi:hypothetical protein
MTSNRSDETDLVAQRDVITLCNYAMCPTIKSNNGTNAMNVVKSDENSHSIKAGSNHNYNNHYKPLENRSLGVQLQ